MISELPRDEDFVQGVRSHMNLCAGTLSEPLRPLLEALITRPGKYLRSHLLEVCSRFGNPNYTRLVRLGAIVELLHCASLLHDDVIDRAATRRGAPTAHKVAGPELAVLTGTACFAQVGAESADLGGVVSGAVSDAVAELSRGELLDVQRAFDPTVTTADYVELARSKTGELFRLCCVLGAQEAQVATQDVRRLDQFGSNMGIAFQIVDDCLDLRIDADDKPVGTDHLLGLFGLPTLCALSGPASTELTEVLMSPSIDATALTSVRKLVHATGGVEQAMTIAERHYDDAVSVLGPLTKLPAGEALLVTAETMWRRQWT